MFVITCSEFEQVEPGGAPEFFLARSKYVAWSVGSTVQQAGCRLQAWSCTAAHMHSALSVFPCVTSRCAFIAGEWVHTALTFATLDPSSELPLTEVASCSADDVHAAVLAATDALNGPSWGYASTAYQRSSFLRRLAAVLEEHKQDIANLDSLDEGKPKVLMYLSSQVIYWHLTMDVMVV